MERVLVSVLFLGEAAIETIEEGLHGFEMERYIVTLGGWVSPEL